MKRQYHDISRLGKPCKERRASRRWPRSKFHQLKSTGIVAGPKIRVLNVSRKGVLFASDAPMAPGTTIHLHLVASDIKPIILSGELLRSRLVKLQDGQPIYHSAAVIDQDFPLLTQVEIESNAEERILRAIDALPDGEIVADISEEGEDQTTLTVTVEVPDIDSEIS